ncbi:hypothetical protein [Umezawaea sp. Da 62-37]|uniref:hypothetical protein n=1 Tax=Umezawaea sp. Da 62-37 TaxID=3075927 RepID=UPI0028F6C166|nr:hypothetical protein [Umezawaea sp. Da 62-37]WNV91259.1 hypothetical protein RM788_24180 [Umezawaea sp. Da 62-37]
MGKAVRRALGALLIGGLATTGLVAFSATPASAMRSPAHMGANLLRIADSGRPTENDLNYYMAPIGKWRDGNGPERTSKSYFTYMLSNFDDYGIVSATASVTEISVNDCSKPRATELRRTDVATHPTWRDQPAEFSRLTQVDAEPGCVSSRITWDVLDAVRDAVDSRNTLTLALRMPEERMSDLAYGRWYDDDLAIDLVHITPPTAPADLAVDGLACQWNGVHTRNLRPVLGSTRRNPWYGWSETVVSAWDVADPGAAFTTVVDYGEDGPMEVRLPEGFVVDGHTYEWTARARDNGGDLSRLEAPCRFTIAPTPVTPPSTTTEGTPATPPDPTPPSTPETPPATTATGTPAPWPAPVRDRPNRTVAHRIRC